MPQFIADLCSYLLIKVLLKAVAVAAVDGREVLANLLIAFARIGCAQFVESFDAVLMEDISCGAYGSL